MYVLISVRLTVECLLFHWVELDQEGAFFARNLVGHVTDWDWNECTKLSYLT